MKLATKARTIAVTAATAFALAAGMLIAAAPADAAGASNCGNNLCVIWTSGTSSTPTIRMYAADFTFTGHFELQTPNHKVYNSIESTWHYAGTGNYFNRIPAGSGTYCGTAWEQTGVNTYTKIGYACITA